MDTFVLKLQDIGEAGKDYAFPVLSSWTREAFDESSGVWADVDGEPGELAVHAERTGADVLVRGTLRARVFTACSRCLGPAAVTVSSQIVTLLSPQGGQASQAADDVDVEDVDREYFTGDELVLDDIVRQHILLECPMQPLCDDACPGVAVPSHLRPPTDGPDPRFAPLMKLARELKNDEE